MLKKCFGNKVTILYYLKIHVISTTAAAVGITYSAMVIFDPERLTSFKLLFLIPITGPIIISLVFAIITGIALHQSLKNKNIILDKKTYKLIEAGDTEIQE